MFKKIFNHLVQGNGKVGNNTLIFNLGSAHDCPAFKLNLCKIGFDCYAYQTEVYRFKSLPFRRRQERLWKQANVEDFFGAISIKALLATPEITHMRFNESGDFHTQDCVSKMSEIADKLHRNLNIGTYTYTARKDLDFSNASEHLVINGQGFDPNSPSSNKITVCNFTDQLEKSPIKCPGKCVNCHFCKEGGSKEIGMALHGWRKMKIRETINY